jgi:CubicO group peptidase (beta-lactamase class C family)
MAAFDAALAYHERHAPIALVIARDGEIVRASYADAGDEAASLAHPLYSGTKAFWGVLCATMAGRGELDLDAPVAATLPEWEGDAWKRRVTLRQLLSLTAGVPFGGLGSSVPLAAKALATTLAHEPGTTFTYGGIPLQIVGEVLRRKTGREPHALLHEYVLDPLGVVVASWRTLRDGTKPLPTGASLSAVAWLRYGQALLAAARGEDGSVPPRALATALEGSAANPGYGLGLWLATHLKTTDLFYASGAGGQALYVLPDARIVAVRFGRAASFKHEAFVKRLRADAIATALDAAQP